MSIRPKKDAQIKSSSKSVKDGVILDLAMLVRVLVVALAKIDPSRKIVKQATDYLQRHGLQGSPLKDIEKPDPSMDKWIEELEENAKKWLKDRCVILNPEKVDFDSKNMVEAFIAGANHMKRYQK